MGFRKEPKMFRLKFEDEAYEGFECTLRSLSIDDYLRMTEFGLAAQAQSSDLDIAKANTDATKNMLKLIAYNLVSWNLENELGDPIPAVLAQCIESGEEVGDSGRCKAHSDDARERCAATGLVAQDLDFITDITKAWMTAIAGVPDPLPNGSSGGGTSLELSIPMDVKSENPQN